MKIGSLLMCTNLVKNAAKFRPPHDPSIFLSYSQKTYTVHHN